MSRFLSTGSEPLVTTFPSGLRASGMTKRGFGEVELGGRELNAEKQSTQRGEKNGSEDPPLQRPDEGKPV